jgi:glutathione peroxidase
MILSQLGSVAPSIKPQKMKFALSLIIMAITPTLQASLFNHEIHTLEGVKTTLGEHKGKVILVVNVASKCGFTSQYKGLEELYQKFKDYGFVILGFPCNQFGGQEPGSAQEIRQFCSTRYNVSFPIYSKVEVNGTSRHPIFTHLVGEGSPVAGNIKWNFTKILIGKDGKTICRYGSLTSPTSQKLVRRIEEALKQ